MHRGWKAAALAAVLGVGGAASAHELVCEQYIDGAILGAVGSFPATVQFQFRIFNVHPTAESVALSVEDPALASYGFTFSEPLPLGVPVGGYRDASFSLRIDSLADCERLAAADGDDDGVLTNTFRVTWDLGETQCTAQLLCFTSGPCPGGVCLTGGPTRDEGYFKTHEQLVEACLSSGPVDLGALGQVKTREQALGVLWGSPTLHNDGQPRSSADALRFDVGRELLVATCNSRVYGAKPQDASLLDSANKALGGGACEDLSGLKTALRGFNTSGTSQPQPAGVDAGPATPVHARTVADDFTRPSGTDCASAR